MKTLTKAKLVEGLTSVLEITKDEARSIVDAFFETIVSTIADGEEEVRITGFGKFSIRDKNARPGRNPKTGEVIPIEARRIVSFNPSQKLRDQVKGYASTTDQNNEKE